MDKDLNCLKEMIARLDIRIDKLLKLRKNIVLDTLYLNISTAEEKITLDKPIDNLLAYQ